MVLPESESTASVPNEVLELLRQGTSVQIRPLSQKSGDNGFPEKQGMIGCPEVCKTFKVCGPKMDDCEPMTVCYSKC